MDPEKIKKEQAKDEMEEMNEKKKVEAKNEKGEINDEEKKEVEEDKRPSSCSRGGCINGCSRHSEVHIRGQ